MTSLAAQAEQAARALLARNGEPDPHPSLLADTVREVEYSQARADRDALVPLPVHTVEKNVYDVPCDHPMCSTLHKDLPDGHEWARTEWVILEDGERAGEAASVDPFARKRDAMAWLRRNGLA